MLPPSVHATQTEQGVGLAEKVVAHDVWKRLTIMCDQNDAIQGWAQWNASFSRNSTERWCQDLCICRAQNNQRGHSLIILGIWIHSHSPDYVCAFHHYEKRPPGPLCSSAFKLQKPRAHDTISELRSSSARTAFVSIDKMVRICIISLKCALHSSQHVSPTHG